MMKICICFILIALAQPSKSQSTKDYIYILTSGLRQTWKLDSISFDSQYTDLKKETVVLFRLDNQAVVIYNSQKKDTVPWYLEKKEKYAMLTLGNIGEYEIDFLERNKIRYMRLRNEIGVQKDKAITEYF